MTMVSLLIYPHCRLIYPMLGLRLRNGKAKDLPLTANCPTSTQHLLCNVPRGKKTNPTGRTKQLNISVSDSLAVDIEILACRMGLLNPRTGKGNRSKLVEVAIAFLQQRIEDDPLTIRELL